MSKQKKSASQNIKDAGRAIKSISKILKLLAKPGMIYVVIAILFIILTTGIIFYFISGPSMLIGWIQRVFFGSDIYELQVDQEELIEFCNQLEELDIDLEAYGLVEEITRKRGTAEYNGNSVVPEGEEGEDSEEVETDGIASKGEIISVKSKYLEAYIVSERKTYMLAQPESWSWGTNEDEEYNHLVNKLAIEEFIYDEWDQIWPAIEEILEGESLSKEEAKEQTSDYLIWKINEGRSGDEPTISGTLKNYLLDEDEKEFKTIQSAVNVIAIGIKGKINSINVVRNGLIYLEGLNDDEGEITEWDGEGVWSEGGNNYKVSIDKDNKWFIVNVGEGEVWNIINKLGLVTQTRYAYDLNGWTTKYGKSAEFLIALHMATLAPDFAYEVATHPAMDAKVHIDLFPVEMNISLQTEEGEGAQTLDEFLEEINRDENLIATYESKIIDEVSKYEDPFGVIRVPLISPTLEESRQALLSDFQKWDKQELRTLKDGVGHYLTRNWAGSAENRIVNEVLQAKLIPLTINGVITYFSWNEVFDSIGAFADSITTCARDLQGDQTTATPYITKVVNHWYRNQYFINEDESIEEQKQRVRSMLIRIYSYINGFNPDEVNATINGQNQNTDVIIEPSPQLLADIALISEVSDTEALKTLIDDLKARWTSSDSAIQTQIDNEFVATVQEIESNIAGIAYKVDSNISPIYYRIVNPDEQSRSANVRAFLKQLYVKETRNRDLVQIHNPVFEDNSQYIRKLLKEKYYIYQGDETNKNGGEELEEGTSDGEDTITQTLPSEITINNGKQYISQKAALNHIALQIEQCTTDRQDEIYMYRDLKELFEDFEFDFENTEKPAQKILDNIMPAYKPYTPWPSEYEKSETNCTKMIYKTNSSDAIPLKAPADGKIARIDNNIIEIDIADETQTKRTLYIEVETGTLTTNITEGTTVEKGATEENTTTIGTVSAEQVPKEGEETIGGQGSMIVLKLRLFSDTKQILKVEDYMTVKNWSYDELKEQRPDDLKVLYSLQLREVEVEKEGGVLGLGSVETEETILQRYAVVNTVFNKIASPYYPQYSSPVNTCTQQGDYLKYSTSRDSLNSLENNKKENNKNAQYAIKNALIGVDVTKTKTLIGATRYFALNENYYSNDDQKNQCLEEANSMPIKMQIGDRMYGITEAEYRNYLGDVLSKKIDEVIYQLNIAHNEAGTEADRENNFLEFTNKFNSVKEYIIEKYFDAEENILQGCSPTTIPEGDKVITNVVKSNIVPGKPDENGNVVDEFLLTINSNYTIKWTITYTLGEQGKIEGDIGESNITFSPIMNY